jgi:hypothetical protein
LRFLFLHLAVTVIATWSGYLEVQVLEAIKSGAFESDEALEAAANASDARQGVVGISQFLVFITSGVLSLKWIHRACFNARVRASVMTFTPGWSVGWYFIPIGNLWKPYQAMKEIWETTAVQAHRALNEGGVLLGWWWTFWLVSNAVANAALRMSFRTTTIDDYLLASKTMLASDVLNIPLTLLFIQIVKNISSMQEVVRASPPRPEAAAPGANW